MAVSPLPRRWNQLLFFTAVLVFLLYLSRHLSLYPPGFPIVINGNRRGGFIRGGGIVGGGRMFKGTPQKDGTRFQWKDVHVRHPVEKFAKLPPASEAKALPAVQFDFNSVVNGGDADAREVKTRRREAVKETFRRCWYSYRKYAWMKDEIAPISGEYKNTFGGWAATLVDSLDTLWIMDLKDEFAEAVEAVVDIDFGSSTLESINVFETTIRHLGGFLSAYDLSGDDRLLTKAIELGEMLYVAFDTPNRLPKTRWNLAKAAEGKPQSADSHVLLAEIGSLSLEFTRLSQLTGDMRWYDAVHRITDLLERQQNQTKLPGMWPMAMNAYKADLTQQATFTLGAMADSMYEYLPKMHALLGGTDPIYKKMYDGAIDTAIAHTLWRPMTPESADVLFSGTVTARHPDSIKLESDGQHLTCFAGGMFALGGRLFERPGDVELGRRLTDGCVYTYKSTPSGLGPEVFSMHPCPRESTSDPSSPSLTPSFSSSSTSFPPCPWNETLWHEQILAHAIPSSTVASHNVAIHIRKERLGPAFTKLHDRRYLLRPEAVESVFLLYRITGAAGLQETAWEMWTAIDRHTRTTYGNAAVADVTGRKRRNIRGMMSVEEEEEEEEEERMEREKEEEEGLELPLVDSMESFWMAETLKYLYLMFSEEDVISLDEWVFNTEAHPLRRTRPGTGMDY